MFTQEEKQDVLDYLENVEGRIYIGCDSVRYTHFNKKTTNKERWARYAVVLAVHIDNSKGCKIFHYIEAERDYDQKGDKPRLRLMSEVYKAVECYLEFGEALEGREVEMHLDVNPKKEHASNQVVKQAVGYVKGMTDIDALIKPLAFAGSFGADWYARNKHK